MCFRKCRDADLASPCTEHYRRASVAWANEVQAEGHTIGGHKVTKKQHSPVVRRAISFKKSACCLLSSVPLSNAIEFVSQVVGKESGHSVATRASPFSIRVSLYATSSRAGFSLLASKLDFQDAVGNGFFPVPSVVPWILFARKCYVIWQRRFILRSNQRDQFPLRRTLNEIHRTTKINSCA